MHDAAPRRPSFAILEPHETWLFVESRTVSVCPMLYFSKGDDWS